ncbi:HAMP domain-containing sensor histidine kinase [Flavobacterium sp.]|uniref:sensor histidine kinase n=1 Tax=Flavobacterium sp. TaxID=239 RepID=UPI0025BC931B|nr:HAMP domain-containing sensor histidine kinase [Flavobacterium sp.]MBA4154139.1 hypothetical protein [Flavobacterium sp.]
MSEQMSKLREFLHFSRKDFVTAKNRKIIHYSLLVALVVMQFLLGLTIYNEWINQNKLNALKAEMQLADKVRLTADKTQEDYMDAQWQLQTFFLKRETTALEKYFELMGGVVKRMDTLHGLSANHARWKQLIAKKNLKEHQLADLKMGLDTLLTYYLADSTFLNSKTVEFKSFPEQEILQNVEVETHIKAGQAARKNLFSRLMAAFSGRVQIQKDIVENTVKMKYGKKTTSGTVQEQMKELLQQASTYYKELFVQWRNSFYGLKKEDEALMALNEALVTESHLMLADFNRLSNEIYKENAQAVLEQDETNHTIRIFALFGLIGGLLLLTLFLVLITRLAFQKEEQLTQAQTTIQQHLVFKTKIVGMLSHEIRSPLSLIGVFSKRLSQRFSEVETKEVFQSLQYTANSLLVLVNQVLDFSKTENNKLSLKKEPFELSQELNALFSNLQILVEQSGNQLIVPTEQLESCSVKADLVKIQQLFYNLVGNANRFTQKGIIRIAMAVQPQGNRQVRMMVEIKDNGKGIPPKEFELIMEAVVHGKETVQLHEISTGLGLLLCREIITLYQGSFSINSEVNCGTTVAFSLVLEKEGQA